MGNGANYFVEFLEALDRFRFGDVTEFVPCDIVQHFHS